LQGAKNSKFLNEYNSSLVIIEIGIDTLDLLKHVRLCFWHQSWHV